MQVWKGAVGCFFPANSCTPEIFTLIISLNSDRLMQAEQIQQLHRNTTHAPDLPGTDTAGGDHKKDREKGGQQGQEAGTAIPKELLKPSPSSQHSRLVVRAGTACTH